MACKVPIYIYKNIYLVMVKYCLCFTLCKSENIWQYTNIYSTIDLRCYDVDVCIQIYCKHTNSVKCITILLVFFFISIVLINYTIGAIVIIYIKIKNLD